MNTFSGGGIMIGVTPVGIVTYLPEESRRFYHGVLGVEQVYPLRSIDAPQGRATVLRLESPQIEVFSVETRQLDATPAPNGGALCGSRAPMTDSRLILHPNDPAALQQRLVKHGVTIRNGIRTGFRFEDLNGITWETAPEDY